MSNMNNDPSNVRIIVEVPRENVSELMTHLGAFALWDNINVQIDDTPPETDQPRSYEEGLKYNPALVEMLPATEGGELIPIVTERLLREFAVSRGENSGQAHRLLVYVRKSTKFFLDEPLKEIVKEMLYLTPSSGGRYDVSGIKVSHIKALRQVLGEEAVDFPQIGVATVNLLRAYCSELFPDDATMQP